MGKFVIPDRVGNHVVGRQDGRGDGPVVGKQEDCTVGNAEGRNDGSRVGDAEGIGVGSSVGRNDGRGEGRVDGTGEGFVVGILVGNAVGITVQRSSDPKSSLGLKPALQVQMKDPTEAEEFGGQSWH